MRRLGGLLTGLFLLTFLLVVAVGAVILFLQTRFEAPGPLTEDRVILVEPGRGMSGIARQLEDEGIVSDQRIFMLGVLAHRQNGNLKAGEYEIAAHASMKRVMNTLVAGKSIQHRLTIPEGLTTEQILARIEAHPALEGEIVDRPPEGSLLPDTYLFTRGVTRQEIVDRMRAAQRAVLRELWAKRSRSLPLATPEEAVILASIVEKETSVPEERARVAAVFVNRLKRRMRLQSDPTIIYGIVGPKGALGRPLTKADIATHTPYNTYRIDGLPPTPIANPGRDALAATLAPEDTDALYFVADGSGGHAFATTLSEHNANVGKWRVIERARREARAAAEADDGAGEGGEAEAEAPAASDDAATEPATDAEPLSADGAEGDAAAGDDSTTDAAAPAGSATEDDDRTAGEPPAAGNAGDTVGDAPADGLADTIPDAAPAPGETGSDSTDATTPVPQDKPKPAAGDSAGSDTGSGSGDEAATPAAASRRQPATGAAAVPIPRPRPPRPTRSGATGSGGELERVALPAIAAD